MRRYREITVTDVVIITRVSESDGGGSAGESTAGPGKDEMRATETYPLQCWICRRPLSEDRCVRWRGEPIHPDCR